MTQVKLSQILNALTDMEYLNFRSVGFCLFIFLFVVFWL